MEHVEYLDLEININREIKKEKEFKHRCYFDKKNLNTNYF